MAFFFIRHDNIWWHAMERGCNQRVRHILFFDGTANSPRSQTNIYRLFVLTIQGDAPDGVLQEKRYWPGVGVEPLEKFWGGAFARKLSDKLLSVHTSRIRASRRR
jgi:hypothetical protein